MLSQVRLVRLGSVRIFFPFFTANCPYGELSHGELSQGRPRCQGRDLSQKLDGTLRATIAALRHELPYATQSRERTRSRGFIVFLHADDYFSIYSLPPLDLTVSLFNPCFSSLLFQSELKRGRYNQKMFSSTAQWASSASSGVKSQTMLEPHRKLFVTSGSQTLEAVGSQRLELETHV